MNKKTVIEREYKDGELVKETETIEEYEGPKYIQPSPYPSSPTIFPKYWWKQPWTLTTGTWEQGTDGNWRKVR